MNPARDQGRPSFRSRGARFFVGVDPANPAGQVGGWVELGGVESVAISGMGVAMTGVGGQVLRGAQAAEEAEARRVWWENHRLSSAEMDEMRACWGQYEDAAATYLPQVMGEWRTFDAQNEPIDLGIDRYNQWPDPTFGHDEWAVDHINGDSGDNNPENLRIVDPRENHHHYGERLCRACEQNARRGPPVAPRVRDLLPRATASRRRIVFDDLDHPRALDEVRRLNAVDAEEDAVRGADTPWSPELAGGMTIDELLGLSDEFKPPKRKRNER